ncbi:MAG: hypothetical protein KGL42_17870 [Betaproteobacteria bacterium]|nr:hypothetical protein [Betaproteobacteria bacterium]
MTRGRKPDLTAKQCARIAQLARNGMRTRDIAKKFSKSVWTIRSALRRNEDREQKARDLDFTVAPAVRLRAENMRRQKLFYAEHLSRSVWV